MKLIDNHIKNIVSLCKRYKVNRLFVFGSVLTDRFNDESDIDLVVDFKKDEVEDYFDNYFDFKYSLQDLFGRKVDLVEGGLFRQLLRLQIFLAGFVRERGRFGRGTVHKESLFPEKC